MVLNDVSGVVAIRMNEWKYIEDKVLRPTPDGKPPRKPEPQLYNLKQDPIEENNVIDQHPEIAASMQDALDRIRQVKDRNALSLKKRNHESAQSYP